MAILNKVDKFVKGKAYNSLPATVVKIIDPTGISSYGDVYNAWTDNKFDYKDIVEPLGALPMVGPLARMAKIGKFADLAKAEKIVSAGKYADVINAGGRTIKKTMRRVNPYVGPELDKATKLLKDNDVLIKSQIAGRVAADAPNVVSGVNQVKSTINSRVMEIPEADSLINKQEVKQRDRDIVLGKRTYSSGGLLKRK
jgi:hypothetical protein